MTLLDTYKTYLTSQKSSPATVKNYLSDVSRFVRWFETTNQAPFDPNLISSNTIQQYRSASSSSLSSRSFARHYASLRHFLGFLRTQYDVRHDWFSESGGTQSSTQQPQDPYLKGFQDYLYESKASESTLKNYLIDIKQFLAWTEQVTALKEPWHVGKPNVYEKINTELIEEYKDRLIHDAGFSPISVNRKLSSIRKYFSFLKDQGALHNKQSIDITRISNVNREVITGLDGKYALTGQEEVIDQSNTLNSNISPNSQPAYSRFAPIRLVQKTGHGISHIFDHLVTFPIAKCIKGLQKILWRGTGKKIFESTGVTNASKNISKTAIDTAVLKGITQGVNTVEVLPDGPRVENVKKSFYAPYAVSLEHMPLHKKLWHHIRHSRPNWYKKYHSYPLAHYINFGLLLSLLIIGAYFLLPKSSSSNSASNSLAMLGSSPPTRVLSFKGKLTDRENLPIAAKIPLRFAIYNSRTASGSALLWEEVKLVSINPDGTFNANLGQETNLPAHILDSYQELYLGVTVRDGKEMKPRQQISTSSFASNAARLQGMLPITANNAGDKNVILALDSAGNLSVGGTNGTIFQATNGEMNLTGETLLLSTNSGSNGNVILSPDGKGAIDFQAAIFNSTNESILPGMEGALAITDNLALLATSSATPAVLINQDGTGDLISASSSGIARFSLDYTGNGTFAGDLAVNGDSLLTSTTSFAVANTNTINLLIGGQATAIQLGAKTGATTINHDLLVNGNITLGDSTSDNISFRGGIAQDSDIIPLTTTGTNDLGSATNPWDNLYVNNIVAGNIGSFGFWQRNNSVLSPTTITDGINLGNTATSSATVHLAGITGDNSFISTGNFGLGTNAPEANLHVNGTNNGKALVVFNDTASTSGGEVILTASAAGTTRFTLDRGGTLNIVGGSYRINGDTVLTGSTLGSGITSSSLTSVGTLANLNVSGPVFASISGTTAFTVADNGNVGIGDVDPATDKLHVLGDIRVGTSGADGCIKSFDGTAIAGSCSSDVRFKTDIQPVENVLGKLKQLRPVSYRMRSNEFPEYGFGNNITYGLIAQEVEQVFPHLVGTDKRGYKTVNYGPELFMLQLQSVRELALIQDDQQTAITSFATQLPLTPAGDLEYFKESVNKYIARDQNGSIMTRVAGFAKVMSASITAGWLQAKEASFDTLAITTEKMSIAGVNLREYILSVVQEAELINPVVRTDIVATNIITPLSDDSDIAVSLKNDALSILNSQSATASAVASIDREGNASFSGTLRSNNLQTNDASISGTLRAGSILADSIEGLDAKLATLSGQQNVTNVYNIYTTSSPSASLTNTPATPSATPTQAQNNEQTATDSANFDDSSLPETETLQTEFMDLASASASLAYVPNFRSDFATITQGLMVYETASMADVSISSQLAIGGNLILAENSINVLGANLELQPLRQGNIAFMGGLMELDTDGNLKVAGNALFAKDVTVKGRLSANIIAPIPGENVLIDLSNPSNPTNPSTPSFTIKGSSNSAVLAVNHLGDLIASGTATLGSLNIVRGVSADTSAIDTVASGSAGLAAITAGYTSRTIYSPYVTEESLIYITPRSETTLAVPYLARQTPEDKQNGIKGSFTVQIPTFASEDVLFNWWIIN